MQNTKLHCSPTAIHPDPYFIKARIPKIISYLEGLYTACNFGGMEHSLYSNTFQCPFSFGKFHLFKTSHQDGPLITLDNKKPRILKVYTSI